MMKIQFAKNECWRYSVSAKVLKTWKLDSGATIKPVIVEL
jgi:hypothetical protein